MCAAVCTERYSVLEYSVHIFNNGLDAHSLTANGCPCELGAPALSGPHAVRRPIFLGAVTRRGTGLARELALLRDLVAAALVALKLLEAPLVLTFVPASCGRSSRCRCSKLLSLTQLRLPLRKRIHRPAPAARHAFEAATALGASPAHSRRPPGRTTGFGTGVLDAAFVQLCAARDHPAALSLCGGRPGLALHDRHAPCHDALALFPAKPESARARLAAGGRRVV